MALRWYVDGDGGAEAVSLLASGEPLLAPDLVVVEVTNAGWKLVRAGKIAQQHGARIAAAVPTAFTLLESSARLAVRAFELAATLDHPVYDCLYVVLAEQAECQLITADRRLASKLSGTRWQALARPLR